MRVSHRGKRTRVNSLHNNAIIFAHYDLYIINKGTKRPRQVDKGHVHNNEEEPTQPSGGVTKESNSGRGKETSSSSSSSSVKPPKKKVKTIKKK